MCGIEHRPVALAKHRSKLLALLALALKSFVNGLAESLPEFLLLAPLQRHPLRFLLPSLLQFLDGIDAQRSAGLRGRFCDHLLPRGNTGLLGLLKRFGGLLQHSLPLGLQFCKYFFTHMPGFTPAAAEFAQLALRGLPVSSALLGKR